MEAAAPSLSAVRLAPSGRLIPTHAAREAAPQSLRRALEALEENEAAGLFALAAQPLRGALPPDLAYWYELSFRYLTARCRTPEGAAELSPIDPLSESDAVSLLLSAPPMEGAEYLSADLLARLWKELDEHVRGESARAGGLDLFLKDKAPLWHQVGRVCFHLAENKKEPDYPFAFMATYAPRMSRLTSLRYQPLSRALQEFAGEGNRRALVSLLAPVQRAAEKSPLIKDLVDTSDIYHPLAWTPEDAYRFLQEIPLYEESGILVRLPDWWARRPRPRVAVRIGAKGTGVLGAGSVLDFQVGVAVGDLTLTEKEVKELLAGYDGLLFLKGRWVEVDRQKLREALDHWKRVEASASSRGISFAEGMRLLAGAPTDLVTDEGEPVREWSFVHAGEWLRGILDSLRSPEAIQSDLPGKGLHAVLRHYQETGVRWLRLLSGLGLGACLADDMGLGKTVQVLALLLMTRGTSSGPSLIVMPASLLANWKAEIEKFAPSLRVMFLHPSMDAGQPQGAGALDAGQPREGAGAPEDLDGVEAAITSYGMLLRLPWLQTVDWDVVILDEAQAIKNPAARQTRAVKSLKARARVALTGTPVENRLTDLWSLFDFLSPGLLGSAARFKEFVKGLDSKPAEHYAPLRSLVQPYILRRMKTDRRVISDLPEKTELKVYCGLTKRQAALYERIVKELAEMLDKAQGIQRRGAILSTLLKLKQVCNHPAHLLGDAAWEPSHSGKLVRLEALCAEIASRQERALFFTQFREAAEPLAGFLAGVFGRAGLVMHGGTPVKERRRFVDAFQAEDGPPFFVLSLKVGGTGLNLTEATHVVHFDRWWNPAVESQATDRAFRIGQKKNVMVHKLICRGTVEEKIDALLEQKTALAGDVLDVGAEALLTEMGNTQLLATVSLNLQQAQAEA